MFNNIFANFHGKDKKAGLAITPIYQKCGSSCSANGNIEMITKY